MDCLHVYGVQKETDLHLAELTTGWSCTGHSSIKKTCVQFVYMTFHVMKVLLVL